MPKRALSVLLLLAFLDSSAFGLIYPLFSSMLFDPKWHFVDPSASETVRGLWLGVFISATPIMSMLVSPFLGNLSDRIGRRPVILSCLAFASVAWLWAGYGVSISSPWHISFARVTMGISVASFAIANAAIADMSVQADKGWRYAWMGVAFGVGFAVGPLLAGIFSCETAFWSESLVRPFVVASFLSTANFVLVFLYFPETVVRTVSQEFLTVRSFLKDLVDVSPSLMLLLVATFLFCFGWSFYIDFIPVWWIKQFHLTASQVGLFFGYGSLWYVLSCAIFVGPVLRHVKPLTVFPIAAGALFIGIWALFVENSPRVFWWLLPVQNIAASFLFPVAATAVSSMASEEHQGRVMGYHASAESLGFGVAPLISGPFLGIHLLMPVALGGLAVFMAGALVMRLRDRSSDV